VIYFPAATRSDGRGLEHSGAGRREAAGIFGIFLREFLF